jgi:hypothetical protein
MTSRIIATLKVTMADSIGPSGYVLRRATRHTSVAPVLVHTEVARPYRRR